MQGFGGADPQVHMKSYINYFIDYIYSDFLQDNIKQADTAKSFVFECRLCHNQLQKKRIVNERLRKVEIYF